MGSERGLAGLTDDDGLTGAGLARAFHAEVVGPLLLRELPGLRCAAARLGSGSDVLGLDDAMSRDHDWGCRLTVLVDEPDRGITRRVGEVLERDLPDNYRGQPVRFATTWDAAVKHRVEVATVGQFVASRLGVNPAQGLSVLDWLTLSGQGVLEVTAGPVFADQTSELGPARAALRWYPPDIERYVLAAGWQRIAQCMPMLGRTAQRGDELGSLLLSAALARDLMRLAFLLHRRWPPYPKWLGSMFTTLPSARELTGLLTATACASGWRQREDALAAAIEVLLSVQRARGLHTPVHGVTPFWDRPYRGVDVTVAAALIADITDPEVARLPPGVGAVEQWADNPDVLAEPHLRTALTSAYRAWISAAE